ncbi:hypothetical protein F4823DRAFT_145661 [Ustulina deusta]|nr:hypothetical protein F4823DRAFT_145661 [Ustulina deusta]
MMLGGKYTRIVDCFTPHYYVLEFDIPHYVFIPHTGYWEAVSNQPQPRPASGGSGRVRTYTTVQLAAGMSGIRLSFLRRRRPFISVSGGAVHSRKSSLSSRTVLNATEDCRKKLTFSISGSSSLVSSLCSANQIRRQVAKVAWYLPCALTVGSSLLLRRTVRIQGGRNAEPFHLQTVLLSKLSQCLLVSANFCRIYYLLEWCSLARFHVRLRHYYT